MILTYAVPNFNASTTIALTDVSVTKQESKPKSDIRQHHECDCGDQNQAVLEREPE